MLRAIAKNIWVQEQPLKFLGLEVGTRMTVIRLKNGELIVISPIQANETVIEELNEIGNVSLLIAPNLYHHLFLSDFKAIYPKAKILAPPGLELKRPDIPIDRKLEEKGQIGTDREVEYLLFAGLKFFDLKGFSILNEIVFLHRESHTLILTDTAYHFDATFPFTSQLVFRVLGGYKQLKPSWLEKIATTEKQKVKQAIEQILAWDFNRVIMAHGSIIETEAKEKLKQGYESFLSIALSTSEGSIDNKLRGI